MIIKTRELEGLALDWAVAKCKNIENTLAVVTKGFFNPSTCQIAGGSIIDDEEIATTKYNDYPNWEAHHPASSINARGITRLIAAMRSYVISKFGEEIEIPDELIHNIKH